MKIEQYILVIGTIDFGTTRCPASAGQFLYAYPFSVHIVVYMSNKSWTSILLKPNIVFSILFSIMSHNLRLPFHNDNIAFLLNHSNNTCFRLPGQCTNSLLVLWMTQMLHQRPFEDLVNSRYSTPYKYHNHHWIWYKLKLLDTDQARKSVQ